MFEVSLLLMIAGIMIACCLGIALDAYFNSLNRKRKYPVGCYRMSVKPRPSGRGYKRNYLKNCKKNLQGNET